MTFISTTTLWMLLHHSQHLCPHIGFGTVGVLSDQNLDGSIDTLTTDGLVRMLPNGLTGLRINPDINQEQSFAILGNTSSTITVITAQRK